MARKDWEHIHFLGDFALNWKNPKIYRFVPYERLKELISENVLIFVSPERWEDPYEKLYFNIDVKGENPALPDIACLCFRTEVDENSAAFWDKAKIAKEPYVKLGLDLYGLCNMLDEFARHTDSEVYIKSVSYQKREEIENAYKNPCVMRDSLKESYIRLLSLKRIAFKYENELRVFITWMRGNKKIEKILDNGLLKIELRTNYLFLKEIMLESSFKSKESVAKELNLQKNVDRKGFFIRDGLWNVKIKKQVSKCPKIKSINYPCNTNKFMKGEE